MLIRPPQSGRSLLILLNGGKMSRNYLLGIGNACRRMGVKHVFAEMDQIRAAMEQDQGAVVQQLDAVLHQQRVGAVLSYTANGCELPGEMSNGTFRTYFEVRGVPHLMFWTDHPQWAGNKIGLRPGLQPAFRSANCFHFVKTRAHAYELSRILGWPNVFDCPLAADPEHLRPATVIVPEYDIVAIYGGQPAPADWMQPFLAQDDPDPQEISEHYTPEIRAELRAHWDAQNVTPALRGQLVALGERLTDLRRADVLAAAAWHIPALAEEFPQAMGWLTFNHAAYFKMTELLWRFRGWLREFTLAYLAKRFRVAVFGGDWSALGCIKPADDGGWVDFADIPKVLARGRVAINLSAGYDEEGITAKPFEIAASGTCMIHNRCRELERFFDVGAEIEAFHRPKEASDVIGSLLADDPRRRSIAAAARARVERDHAWDPRLRRMLEAAGLSPESFKS